MGKSEPSVRVNSEVKRQRVLLGMRQKDLGIKVGCSPFQIANLEKGKSVSKSLALKVLKVLGLNEESIEYNSANRRALYKEELDFYNLSSFDTKRELYAATPLTAKKFEQKILEIRDKKYFFDFATKEYDGNTVKAFADLSDEIENIRQEQWETENFKNPLALAVNKQKSKLKLKQKIQSIYETGTKVFIHSVNLGEKPNKISPAGGYIDMLFAAEEDVSYVQFHCISVTPEKSKEPQYTTAIGWCHDKRAADLYPPEDPTDRAYNENLSYQLELENDHLMESAREDEEIYQSRLEKLVNKENKEEDANE